MDAAFGLAQAVKLQDWYAVAAILCGALVYGTRKLAPGVWGRVPERWRWLVPVLGAGAAGFAEAFHRGVPAREALGAAATAVFGIALPAMGGHHLLKQSVLPYGTKPDGSPASRPPPAPSGDPPATSGDVRA